MRGWKLWVAGLAFFELYAGTELMRAQTDARQVANSKLEVRDAGSDLAARMKQIVSSADGPMWIGYQVAEIPGKHEECCGNSLHGRPGNTKGIRHLEGEGSDIRMEDGNLEGDGKLRILFRAAKSRIERIRLVSDQCQLDAGELQLVWLKDVKEEQSVAYLSELVRGQEFSERGENGVGEQALTAIALHDSASADKALEAFAAPQQPERLREKASFWMGAARGPAGLTALKKMAKADPSGEVRAKVSFALFISKEPGAADEMIRMAHEDGSAHVRGQALFWLAQKAEKKAEAAITRAIADDPDTEVKKKAVFALSLMPKEEGVPKLIEVAENNKNPEVRKQAMFWLGQSGDPRALAFFEKVLKN